MKPLHLSFPIKGATNQQKYGQMFGVNPAIYNKFGIPGHNGLDFGRGFAFGTPVYPALHGLEGVVSLVEKNDFKTRGYGVQVLEKIDEKRTIGTIYWHFGDIFVTAGQNVTKNTTLGSMGNSGFVMPPKTPECPTCGTHVHFGVYEMENGTTLATDYKGYRDPVPYLFIEGEKLDIYFGRDLFLGKSGNDVSWLQTILKLEGFAEDYEPIGYFGRKTQRDVSLLQKKYGITPIFGYFGPKTRKLISSKYVKFP